MSLPVDDEVLTPAVTIAIRPADGRDLFIVSVLAHRIWPESFKKILTQGEIINLLFRIYDVKNLRNEQQQGHRFWLAFNGEEPVGFASAYREGETIWLKKLYILPEWQGCGVGTSFMQTAVRELGPAERMQLLVNRNNMPAMRMYEQRGFTKTGERAVQMGDFHFTDFVFSKTLQP